MLFGFEAVIKSFLSETDEASLLWRSYCIQTFLERDIPQRSIQIPARTIHRLWVMLSHYHGQFLNSAELGRSFGISDMSIRRYVDILEGTFMIRLLQPWFANISKRMVKGSKIYLHDSGIFHILMSIETQEQLLGHPKLGASWKGFVLESVCKIVKPTDQQFYFWSSHSGVEIDLFWQKGGKEWGMEFKYMDSPTLTKSMTISM